MILGWLWQKHIKLLDMNISNMKKERKELKKIYLDDIRNPKSEGWEIIRNFDDFVNLINEFGIPDEISFDHDLGENEKTGYDCAKWLCEYCWTNGIPIPTWNVHSANPVGRDNIVQLIQNYEKKLNY
jgi:hypothetical protein